MGGGVFVRRAVLIRAMQSVQAYLYYALSVSLFLSVREICPLSRLGAYERASSVSSLHWALFLWCKTDYNIKYCFFSSWVT